MVTTPAQKSLETGMPEVLLLAEKHARHWPIPSM